MLSRRSMIQGILSAAAIACFPIKGLAGIFHKRDTMKTELANIRKLTNSIHGVCQYLDVFLVEEPTFRELEICTDITNRIKSTLARFGFEYDPEKTNQQRVMTDAMRGVPAWNETCSHMFVAAATKCGITFFMNDDRWEVVRKDSPSLYCTIPKYAGGAPDDIDIVEKIMYGDAGAKFEFGRRDGEPFETGAWNTETGEKFKETSTIFTTRSIMELQADGMSMQDIHEWKKMTEEHPQMVLYLHNPRAGVAYRFERTNWQAKMHQRYEAAEV